MDATVRAAKEAFVSNLTGTTWDEVDEIIVSPALCMLVCMALSCILFARLQESIYLRCL